MRTFSIVHIAGSLLCYKLKKFSLFSSMKCDCWGRKAASSWHTHFNSVQLTASEKFLALCPAVFLIQKLLCAVAQSPAVSDWDLCGRLWCSVCKTTSIESALRSDRTKALDVCLHHSFSFDCHQETGLELVSEHFSKPTTSYTSKDESWSCQNQQMDSQDTSLWKVDTFLTCAHRFSSLTNLWMSSHYSKSLLHDYDFFFHIHVS